MPAVPNAVGCLVASLLLGPVAIAGAPGDGGTQYAAALRPSRLVNASVRIPAGSGEQSLIMGFVVGGNVPKALLVRAVGPTLATLGVIRAMEDPAITLHDHATSSTVGANDNWGTLPDLTAVNLTTAKVGGYPLPAGSRDAVMSVNLKPGVYSAVVEGMRGSTGVALAELYDADDNSATRLVNISARAQVGVGENALFAGFVIAGDAPKTVLIRALGPDLTALGVAGVLANPRLDLFLITNGKCSLINSNDDWGGLALMTAAAAQVGAYAITNDKEAVLLVTLGPGVYAAQVTGVRDSTGVALVEIYDVQ